MSQPTVCFARHFLSALFVLFLSCASVFSDEPPDEILLGMSTALTGPAADLGNNVKDGVEAAIEEINLRGGVAGKKLRLIALDDGYEPARTAPNMRRLIEEEHALAIIGNVGTPTAIAAIPIANTTRTPFVGAFTGAGALRKTPPDRYVINIRASYAEETAAMVDALIQHTDIQPNEVAFFTQRDGYGDAGFVGGMKALSRNGLVSGDRIAHGRYERNTVSVEKGLAEILLHEPAPKAVIMVGAYAPCAEFIRLSRRCRFSPYFMNVSFVGSDSLLKALGNDGDGVIVTQVVPHPESRGKLTAEYRSAMKSTYPERKLSFGSFEGYIATRVLLRALHSIEGPLDREKVVDALESLGEFYLDEQLRLELSPSEHQASHSIWPTMLIDGQVISIDWSRLSIADSGSE